MMRLKRMKVQVIGITVCAMALMTGCQKAPAQNAAGAESTANVESAEDTKSPADTKKSVDAVSSASKVFYQEASFDQAKLWDAISQSEGSCTIATVNEDGTPDLIIAVPGTVGDSHLFFNWADNATKANAQRTGEAMLSYYVYNPEAEEKMERNQGARIKVALETDQAVLEKLQKENPACSSVSTVFRVEEILPLG